MRKWLMSLIVFLPFLVFAQASNDGLVRGFPITDYVVDMNDSMKIVQVYLEESGVIIGQQVGVLKSAYVNGKVRPGVIGIGRCSIIKGDYYYFTVNCKESGVAPQPGDLMYVAVSKPSVFMGRLVNIAAHSITLTDVKGNPIYDPATIFSSWTEHNEKAAMDSMLSDIRFTAGYYIKNQPSVNVKIKSGLNEGKLLLTAMEASTIKELNTFLDYVSKFSKVYAGKEWKVSEIFATWLDSGSPAP